jgi:signal peptidase II
MQSAVFLLSAVLLVALDQLLKSLITAQLREGRMLPCGPVTIRRVLNRNAPGSVLRSSSALVAFWLVEFGVLWALVQFSPFFQRLPVAIALGAAVGGAGSNVLDRSLRGGVVDFIDLRFWPVFNLADIAIVAGIASVVICL